MEQRHLMTGNIGKLTPSCFVLVTISHFHFLHNDCGIQARNNRVTDLYKHIFNTKFPTLTFIGLGLRICPFLQFSLQAQYVSAVLSARKKLPTEAEMIADEEKDFKEIMLSWAE